MRFPLHVTFSQSRPEGYGDAVTLGWDLYRCVEGVRHYKLVRIPGTSMCWKCRITIEEVRDRFRNCLALHGDESRVRVMVTRVTDEPSAVVRFFNDDMGELHDPHELIAALRLT